jgi:pimeloyl-ACP methyl ester carboxylesterase
MGGVSLFSQSVSDALDRIAASLREHATAGGNRRVLLVPALPGSRLGYAGGDVLWLDVANVRAGRLVELAYGRELSPLGRIEGVYDQLVLRLTLAGFDVGIHAYDWRRPVRALGEDLAEAVRAEGREVHLVTHSFGGLVARAAALSDAPNLGRVVMLGPPSQGSFSVVQGIRGTQWTLEMLAAVDGKNSAEDLAAQAFGTWPSVHHCLPTARAPSERDFYDPGSWPSEGLRPDPDLLREASETLGWLAGATGQLHVIAGYGVPTVERADVDGGVFVYHRSDGGDGFVTTSRARLEGHPCYHVAAPHINMTNHPGAIQAVVDILERGDTDALPSQPPAVTSLSSIRDDDVREPPFGGRKGAEIPLSDLRAMFDEALGFAAPAPHLG